MTFKRAAVLGGGSFGTVIGNILADNHISTQLWMRNADTAEHINREHKNPVYLPDATLNPTLTATTSLEQAVAEADVVFVSVPSKSFRAVVQTVAPLLKPHQYLVSTTKGIEPDAFLLMSDILEEECPDNPVGVLSGPNLAKEIAQRELAATVIASEHSELRRNVQASLSCPYFRIYASNDPYGVELGGALKNIYAIISGFIAARGFGENTKGMIITRSLAEMGRFASALGANPMTFLGLAGVGDLIVTCMSPLSRNHRVGFAIGEGKTLQEAVDQLGEVAEGVNTLRYVKEKADQLGIYMPLVQGAYAVIFNQASIQSVTHAMMDGEHTSDVEFSLAQSDI